MELNCIRLLVADFDRCFKFYSEILELEVSWGKIGGEYASFKMGEPFSLSIFKSDLMSKAIGNENLHLPQNSREKAVIIIKTQNVDTVYSNLKARGVEFINEPADMTGWGMRAVHLRDPEGNLLEFWSDLPKEKWDEELKKEAEEYE